MIQTESNKVVVYPDNLTRDELALNCFNLEKEVTLLRPCPREVSVTTEVARMATKVRQSVKDHFSDQQELPPNVSSLQAGSTEVPEVIDTFLHHLFSGRDSPLTDRRTWLKRSVAQDLVFAITRGRFKPAKHILLPSVVKSLIGNVELIQLLNRLAHSIAYSLLEELHSSLCLQKLCIAEQTGFPCQVTSSCTRIQSLHLIISIVSRTPCQEAEFPTASMELPCSMQFMGHLCRSTM